MESEPTFDGRSIRKIRLYCSACCRSVWHLLHDKRYRAALKLIENNPSHAFTTKHKGYLRGWLFELQCLSLPNGLDYVARSKSERMRALPIYHAAMAAWKSLADAKDVNNRVFDLNPNESVATVKRLVISATAIDALSIGASVPNQKTETRSFLTWLESCVFGNPFRPVAFLPEWRTSDVVSIAQSMYDSREFSPMPLLADALQDAGCEHDDILAHSRGSGPHVRGCWVVDLVLGKS